MRDLSREEKLERQIYLLDKALDDEKWKRTKITFFVLSAIVFSVILIYGEINSWQDFLMCIFAAPISAGFIMFVSLLVTAYMSIGTIQGVENIAKLQGELDAIRSMKYENRNKE
jgi:hypothetical protein